MCCATLGFGRSCTGHDGSASWFNYSRTQTEERVDVIGFYWAYSDASLARQAGSGLSHSAKFLSEGPTSSIFWNESSAGQSPRKHNCSPWCNLDPDINNNLISPNYSSNRSLLEKFNYVCVYLKRFWYLSKWQTHYQLLSVPYSEGIPMLQQYTLQAAYQFNLREVPQSFLWCMDEG